MFRSFHTVLLVHKIPTDSGELYSFRALIFPCVTKHAFLGLCLLLTLQRQLLSDLSGAWSLVYNMTMLLDARLTPRQELRA